MTTIQVSVLTFRRPDALSRGLREVNRQVVQWNAEEAEQAHVLVVDNDPTGSARAVVSGLGSELIRYVVEPKPGIAAARNRALHEAAQVDLLIFLDDDEIPQPGWLAALIQTWRASGAAAVMGRVISLFDPPLTPWVQAGDFYRRPSKPTGTELHVAATQNLLLDLAQVRAAGLAFDESLGLAGGEDSLFTRQLSRAGARLVWCDEAQAVDPVHPSRTTRRWVLARAWSHGNAESRVGLLLAQSARERWFVRARAVVGGIARIAGGSARAVFGIVVLSLRHHVRGIRAVFRGAGMAAGGLGLVYREYARD